MDVSARLVERNAIQSVGTVTDKLPIMYLYIYYGMLVDFLFIN